ncbi:hypothetical protein BJ322DRAFT_1021413 [Thelephora terrestris]|uniref:Uncharacterized protein n=1 Tax=Thelephora terrestris TaxID=56493 RepID=A0A9P6HEW7_9AGAM|nr:hypothetical protein BJ322DRAFT_1021413 [Thelephora terrestris]
MPSQRTAQSILIGSMSIRKPTATQEVVHAMRNLQFSSPNKSVVDGESRQGILSGRKVFTGAAKAVVQEHLRSLSDAPAVIHTYPPLMLPSENEADYSLWCSLCNDRNGPILLCAGCRVGICYADPDRIYTGCMKWHHDMERPDLVFYCPFCCANGKGTFKFMLTRILPKPEALAFRFDPPVVFAVLRLPQNHGRWYKGNAASLYKLTVDLGGPQRSENTLGTFLQENPLAKIVIVVDTHSTQDGQLVYSEKPSQAHNGARVTKSVQILIKFLPRELADVLLVGSEKLYQHRVFVLNASCGDSILKEEARNEIPFGHTAELVLSFATSTVIPALVSSLSSLLILKWATTTLPLMDLIGHAVSPMMIEMLEPVFSGREFGHFHLAKISAIVLGGRLVVCTGNCNAGLISKHNLNWFRHGESNSPPAESPPLSVTNSPLLGPSPLSISPNDPSPNMPSMPPNNPSLVVPSPAVPPPTIPSALNPFEPIKRSGTWQQTKAVAMDYGEGSSQHTTEQATKRVRGEDRSSKVFVQKKPKNDPTQAPGTA